MASERPKLAALTYDHGITYVELEESGAFLVPRSVLPAAIRLGTDSIVSFRIHDADFFALEARGGWIGTEAIASNVRVEVRPKCGLDNLDVLLRWSGDAISVNNAELLEKHLAPGQRLFDVFANRFLRCMRPILSNGLFFEYQRRLYSSPSVDGAIRLEDTYARHLSQSDVRFALQRFAASTNNEANQVLATALHVILKATTDLSVTTRSDAAAILSELPQIDVLEIPQSVRMVTQLVSERRLSGNREYYYPALLAALPILQAVSRWRLGDVLALDVSLRVRMASLFESTIRNIVSQALPGYNVKKGETLPLYFIAPGDMQVELEPDIVVRRLGQVGNALFVVDAKYKFAVESEDHYQMAAYRSRFNPRSLIIVALTEQLAPGVDWARSFQDSDVYRFDLPVPSLENGIATFSRWISELAADAA